MSTNYNILLKSEKKLKELTVSYLALIHEIHQKLWNDVDKHVSSEDISLIFDNTERRQKRSLVMEDELLDECIWTISKDDPRANHLRFIISVICSTKDLTRASEYSQSIAKIIVRNKFQKETIKKLKPIVKLYLDYIDQTSKLYSSTTQNKLDKFDEINSKFEAQFEKVAKEIRNLFKNDAFLQYQVTQINRLIFSTIERLQSLFTTVLFTKKSLTSTLDIKKKELLKNK